MIPYFRAGPSEVEKAEDDVNRLVGLSDVVAVAATFEDLEASVR